jgi:hypothetical protein
MRFDNERICMMERRMTERKAFDHLLQYNLGATAGESGDTIHIAQVQDICADGLGILTDYPLEKDAVIRVGLPAKGFEMLLPVFTEVAWVAPADKRYKAGLRFLR